MFLTLSVSVSVWGAEVTFSPNELTAVTNSDYSHTKENVTIAVTASTVTSEQFRIFKNRTITITSTGGAITNIKFTCTANNTAQYGPGCLTVEEGNYSYSNKVGTWTGSATEIIFTASTNQVRATEIVVTTVASDPSLTTSTTEIDFSNVAVNSTNAKTFTFSGSNLTANANLSISGTNKDYFSINTETVAHSSGSISNKSIMVTYKPTTTGAHTATLTISSTNATPKTIALKGNALQEHTVKFFSGVEEVSSKNVLDGSTIGTLPSATSCDQTNYPYFIGWTEGTIDGTTTTKPTIITTSTTIKANNEYHAVFADKEESTGSGTTGSTTFAPKGSSKSSPWSDNGSTWTFSNITFANSARAGFPQNGTATVTLPTGAVANTITITRTTNAWSGQISLLVKTGSTTIQTLTQPNTTTTINLTSANQKNTYTFSHNNAATKVAYVDNIKVNYTIPATPTTITYITSCSTETSVTLQPNGGTGTAQVLETTDGSLTLPECDFIYEGYRFVGWNTKANGTGTTYQPSAEYTPTENPATLYAKWAKEYTVTYNANGGTTTCEDNKKYIAGEQVTVCTSVPTKDSYTFNGWSYSPSVAITDGQFTMPANDVTITAQWTSNKTATSLSWSATSCSATIDADNTFPALTVEPEAIKESVQYTSFDETIATIDANGTITLLKAGTTTITASYDEDEDYLSASASYTLTVHPSNCRWVETEINDIEATDEVVVMMAHGSDLYALPYDKETASNSNPVATSITLDNFKGIIVDELIWFITKDHESNNFTLSPKTSTGKYLTCNSSNNAVRINTGENRNFTIENDFLKNTAFDTYLAISTTATPKDWRHYRSDNTTISSKAQTLKFYKRECLDATSYWVEGNFTNVTCDTQLPQQLAKDGSITLTFTAADGYALPDNVTVTGATPSWNKATGTLTISNPTANVTITIEALKLHTINWIVGSNSVLTEKVANATGATQTPPDPGIGAIGECANAFMGWTETPLGSAEGQSAPADLCTAAQMKSKHTSVTGDKTFYAVFATAEETGGGTVDATLSFASTAQRTSWSEGQQVWTQNGVTLTNNRGGGSAIADNSNPARFYKNSEIIVTHTSDEITEIVFDCNTEAYATALKNSIGTIEGVTVSNSSDKVTVSFTNAVASFAVTLSSGQVRMDALTVTAGGGTITTYSNYVTNCCATPVPTNGSYTSPSGTSVTLTWDGESTRYHITCANPIIDDHTESTSYKVSSLTECEEYTFYVSADPTDGCESEAITITAQPFIGAKTVTFNPNGGAVSPTSETTSCTNQSIKLPTPTYSGYRFMGWYNAANGGTKIGEAGVSYTPTTDITLYAQWEKEYNVTYNANGGSTTCAGGAYIAGETVTICTTNPTKTGYTFAGWTYSPNMTITDGKFVMPASDVTITAQWTINQYTVTWNPNGGKWGESTDKIVHTYNFGDPVNSPADPTRDGYRFTGWNGTVASTMPATNITYTAQWKQNYTITFHDGDDTTPWTQTIDAELIDLNTYVGTHACGEYTFAGWSTDATQYNDQTANITTWVTGTYTPTANIHLYAVYVKGDLATDFTPNCDGGVYEIWEKGTNQHMAGRQNGGGDMFYTTEWYNGDCTSCEGTDGAPFTITKVADNTYTLQNADGQYITRDSYDGNADELEIKDTWENADRYKWIISEGTNGSWRFTNKAATTYALVFYDKYFQLRIATNVTNGSSYYDLELTPAQTNVYQSNPNCGAYTITFETGGGEFVQGNYKYSTAVTSNLTETTTTRFPAAELEGYTFAGWKDGAPQDDVNYEPYLKKADDNLVVSSNKTYYAVYYYYDEEEDIDWSKEFTTAIYADVNGIKYFLAGTPNGGTMSSTTDCGYVSEVTITPGTGANAGKYKITVNDVGMAPKAGETDLVDGTAWWTITETSVGSGEYKISGEDKRNIVLRNSSYGHYAYNAQGSYNGNYYYPRFGKCLEHHWTSNPTPKPSIKLSGDVYVTATNGCGIMATQPLSVIANNLHAGETLTLTSNSNDVCFSKDRTVNFVKASKPTVSLTLTADATGKIDKEVYVHYKPSTEGDGVPADVVVTATASSVSKNHTIHVRNLPTKFVIATKVGATWYALPANMSEATNPLGVVIEVDETTMTTIAPNTTTYTLWSVKTTATEYDRYTNVTGAAYGDRVRFAAVNYEQRGLWANNNNNSSAIRNYAVINSLGADATAAYEWKVTTTVVDGHWQYTLQTDQDKNQQYLRYWVGATGAPKWGTYAAGNNQLYFLPVTETEPFDYKVVEWYPTKVLVQTEATLATVSATIGGEEVAEPVVTQKGGKLYEISNLPLETNPTKLLAISYTADEITYANNTVIPIIISRAEKNIADEPFATLTADVYNSADLVVRDGAVLTVNGTEKANTFANVTIYPTAKISVPAMNKNGANNKLSVNSLTFFGGIDEIYDGSTYTINKYGVPELSLKGLLNKTTTQMDYIMRVDLDQMYSLTVPYDVQLADIKYWDGSDIALGSALYVSAYDGEARANQSKKTWIYETDFESRLGAATLKAGVGYTISAELQSGVGSEYSILRMPMMSNVASEATETAKTVAVTAWGKDANVTDNHKGWNLVGNPYMTTIQGADDADLVLGYLKETGTGPWEWVEKTYRYVTIPSDDGTYYWQQKFTDAVLPPFKNFFVQVGTTGELVFDLGTRQSMPARSTQAAIEKEVEFEILMSNDARQDNTGLLISEEYSPGYEINADLEKMTGSMSVYTIFGGYKLAYNALSPINASEWIPMGYIAPAAGEYTFRLDDVENIAEQVEHIYIIDYNANNIVDLMDEEYKFTTDKEQNDNRFAINVVLSQDKDNTTTGLDMIQGNNAAPIKFIYHDKMYIQSGGVIYDGTGKQVTNINK